MRWKNEAMEKLRRYDAMRTAQSNIPKEIDRLKEEMRIIRRANPACAPVRGGGCQHDERWLNNMAKRQELEWSLKQVRQWLANTERGLLALSEEERLVLQRLYLYPEKNGIDRLCAELGMEQSSVYRKRDQALERFTIAMYGFADT